MGFPLANHVIEGAGCHAYDVNTGGQVIVNLTG